MRSPGESSLVARGLRNAEIDEAHASRRIEQDVARFDVAVDYAFAKLCLRRGEEGDDGRYGRKRLFDRHAPSCAVKVLRESVAIEPFLDDAAFFLDAGGVRHAHGAMREGVGQHAEIRKLLQRTPLEQALFAVLEHLYCDGRAAGSVRFENGRLSAATRHFLECEILRCLANVAALGCGGSEKQLARERGARCRHDGRIRQRRR